MKKITFLLAFFLSFVVGGYAQIQIGSGNTTNQAIPIKPAAAYNYSQSIYLKSDINTSGSITGLRWYLPAVGATLMNSKNVTIYMGHTSKSVFVNNTDFIPVASLTPVFTGNLSTMNAPWISVTFSQAFSYNGTDNLVIAVDENEAGNSTDSLKDYFVTTATTGSARQSIYVNSTTTNIDPLSPTTGTALTPGYTGYVPNIILDGIVNSCQTPLALNVTDIQASQATISWSENSVSTNGYEYYYSTSTTAPNQNTTSTGSFASAPYTITGLDGKKTYYVWVRRICDEGTKSSWSVQNISFTTPCAAFSSFAYNFDSSTNLPDCVQKLGSLGSLIFYTGTSSYNGSNAFKMNAVSPASANKATVLISKVNNLGAGTNRLKFRLKSVAPSSPGTIEVGYLTDMNDVNTFIPVKEFTSTSIYTKCIADDFSTAPQNAQYIALRTKGDNTSAVYIDDVVWEAKPSCDYPEQLKVSNIKNNGAKVSWEAITTVPQVYQYYVSTSSSLPDLTTEPSGSVDGNLTEVVITSQSPNTVNYVWIRSKCDNTNFGTWVGPIIFNTSCDAISSFYENFDANTNLPTCWTKIGTSGEVSVAASEGTGSSNALKLNKLLTTDKVVVAVPPVNNIPSGNRLRFNMKASKAGETLEIGYLTDFSDASTFTNIKTYTATAANTVYPINEVLPQLNPIPTSPYLAFRFSKASIAQVVIDDIAWETNPTTCLDVSNLAINGFSSNTVKLNWTKADLETEWQYAIGTASTTNPNTLNPVDFNNTDIIGNNITGTVVGLTPSTSHKIWIRSKCNENSFGLWIGPLYLTTTCAPLPDFIQDFEAGTTLPQCWSKIGTSGAVDVVASAGTNASNALKITGNTNSTGIVSMLPVNKTGTGTHILRFSCKSDITDAKLKIGYTTNILDPTKFIPLREITINSNYASQSVDLGTEPVSEILVFQNPGINTTNNIIYIDDVVWEAKPNCINISNPSFTSVTDNTIKLSWTASESDSSWQYALGDASDSDPSKLTAIDFVSPVIDGNLITGTINATPSKTYKVWVRSKCAGNMSGSWIGPLICTTSCAPISSLIQNFDENNNLPTCWTKVGSGTVSIVNLTGVISTNVLSITSTVTDKAVVAMPLVNNAAAGTHRLRFKFRTDTKDSHIQVGYLTNNTNPDSFVFTDIISAPDKDVFYNKTVDLLTNPTTNFLAFKASDASTIYIDEVVWEPKPTCLEMTNISKKLITGSSVSFSWTMGESETAWQYVLGTSADTDPNSLSLSPIDFVSPTKDGTTITGTISGLNPSTSYKVWLRVKCGDNSYSPWTLSEYFTTTCTATDTFFQDFEVSNNLPSCWNKLGSLGTVEINTTTTETGSSKSLKLYSTGTNNPATVAMTPVSNAWAGTHRLRFRCKASLANNTLQIGYIRDINNPDSFVSLQTISNLSSSTYFSRVVNLGTAPESLILAFRNPGTQAYTSIFIDEVVWEPIPTCLDITYLESTSILPDVVNLRWNKVGTETAWQYCLGAPTDSAPNSANAVDFVSPTVTSNNITASVDGLNPSTTYKIWVRSKCDETNGSWVGPILFKTACSIVNLPWSEDFEGASTGLNKLPNCWDYSNSSLDWFTLDTGGNQGPKNIAAGSNSNVWAYSPLMQLTAGTNYKITYYVKMDDTKSGYSMELRYGTKQDFDSNSSKSIFNLSTSGTTTWTKQSIVFTPTTSGYFNLGLHALVSYTATGIHFDDLKIEASTCDPVAVKNINFTDYTPTTGTVKWAVPTSIPTNGYEYFVSTSTLPPNNETIATGTVDAKETQVTIGDLSPDTKYYIYVRSACSDSDKSLWNKVTFKTPCAVISTFPYEENFSTIPTCWSGSSSGSLINGPLDTNTGTWYPDGFLNNGIGGSIRANLSGSNNYGWIISQPFDFSSGKRILSFNYGITEHTNNQSSPMGVDDMVKLLMTTDNGTTWSEIIGFNTDSNVSNTNQIFVKDMTGVTSANVRFAFWMTDGEVKDALNYDFFIDNFKLEDLDLATDIFEKNSFSFHPNPTNGILNLSSDLAIDEISVFNLLGQEIMSKSINTNQYKLDMTELSKGTYLVKVLTNNQIKTIKVIRE